MHLYAVRRVIRDKIECMSNNRNQVHGHSDRLLIATFGKANDNIIGVWILMRRSPFSCSFEEWQLYISEMALYDWPRIEAWPEPNFGHSAKVGK